MGFKGFQIAAEKQKENVSIHYGGSEYQLSHGSVVMAAVTSCTNNCNPSVMLAAGRLSLTAVPSLSRVPVSSCATLTLCLRLCVDTGVCV